MRFLLPLGLFVVVVGFLAVGLERDPRLVPSPLIGKPLPAFELGSLAAPERPLTRADLDGEIYLLNVWASWCAACRVEHPLLVELAKQGQLQLVGLNYKDELEAARRWLVERGDPYRLSLHDPAGQLGLDLGVYGVPETFLVDARGVIRYKHIGPLSPDVMAREILPRIAALRSGS